MEGADNDSTVIKSGYLLKKTKGTLKTFNKRWFVIRDGQLLYSKTHEDPEYIILAHDLRLLNVREVNGANYFEVVIVGCNSTFIKAETEEECKEWITALRKASEVLFHSTEAPRRPSGSAKEKIILQRLVNLPVSLIPPMSEMEIACRNIPGNKFCAECKTKDPEWISINLGIFVCVECSGAHRNVGAHISRIRSLKMDFINNYQWDILLNLGNDKVNSIFVTKCVPTLLNEDSSNDERETFIKSNFEWKSTVVRQDRLMNDCCLLEENMVFENIPVSDGWVQAKNETDLENIALDSIKNRDCAGILNCLVQGLEINKLICGAPLLNLVTNRVRLISFVSKKYIPNCRICQP
uniref:Uncharacterized protein n=1 Tax=Panagrolaimus superbus TaxID=310955 RepID=A0A914Z0T2_9BILA